MILVEHASLMKGAIPVLPLCLAYLLLMFNIIIPGSGKIPKIVISWMLIYFYLGTILSGLICLCIGIPRFSQHDGARGRIGSFIINCIVGVSQAFTVIFCFVGWVKTNILLINFKLIKLFKGWSIWWGTIMIHLASESPKLINSISN